MCHHGCAGGGPLDLRADPDDLACGLYPERQGRDASDVPTAGANELFPVPDAGSLDFDQHLPGFQRRAQPVREAPRRRRTPRCRRLSSSCEDYRAIWITPAGTDERPPDKDTTAAALVEAAELRLRARGASP